MRRLFVSMLIIILFVMVGCKGKESEEVEKNPANENSVKEDLEKQESQAAKEDPYIYPFTGIGTKEEPKNRAIAVMVSNQIQDRPQSGLTKADIVYEILIEGNVTRFMAIYQSEAPEAVGPVRSAREYFFTLAQGYDAIYTFHGAANFVNDMIRERNIENLPGAIHDNDGHLFIREPFRKMPFNSYFQFGAAYEVAEERGYETTFEHEPLLFTSSDAEIPGEDANHIRLDYYGSSPVVEFKYDARTKKYKRFHDTVETVELEIETPIEIDNLFVVEAEHKIFDDVGRRLVNLDTGGVGYLMQHGKVQYVEWENRDGRILPVKDGKVIPFVPGKTWINFIQTVPTPGVEEQITFTNE